MWGFHLVTHEANGAHFPRLLKVISTSHARGHFAIFGLGGAAAASGLDIGTIVSAFVTGGVSGGVTALVIGFLKAKMAG